MLRRFVPDDMTSTLMADLCFILLCVCVCVSACSGFSWLANALTYGSMEAYGNLFPIAKRDV